MGPRPAKPLIAAWLESVRKDFKRLGCQDMKELHEDLYTMKTRRSPTIFAPFLRRVHAF